MGFLLDTNVPSVRPHGDRRVHQRVSQYGGRLFVSAVTLAEVFAWPRVQTSAALREDIDLLLDGLHVLPFDEPVARRFGAVSAALRAAGTPLPFADLLIAVTALEHDLTVVTANRRDFDPVPALRVDDWTTP